MTAYRNPVVLFLATGLVALAVIVVGTSQLSRRAASEEAVKDALTTTKLLARTVAEPALPRGLVAGRPGAVDRFDRVVYPRLLLPDVRRVKVWRADGTIVYSDQTELIGERFPLGAEEREVLAARGSDAEVSDLSKPENRFERGSGGLLEVYTTVISPEGEPLLFEVYFSAAAIESRQQQIYDAFRPITYLALGLVVLVATGLLWAQTQRIRIAARSRERLLQAAVDSSEAERVRIARDLHDGVVQDLAGATFSVAALARDSDVPGHVTVGLEQASASMRSALRSLRSLMVEIYPPDLHARGLASALEDLLAPTGSAGITATCRVEGVDTGEPISQGAVRLVWRVAQEAVRNAIRHAAATRLDVDVHREAETLVLVVSDDGVGFNPEESTVGAHFGLRGLAGLAVEAGATLTVVSHPAEGQFAPGGAGGTTVRLEVPIAPTRNEGGGR